MNSIVDAMWVAVSGALVFFMQPGFSMVESGLTREKNSINVAIKNLTDIGISLFVYWLVGFALMFGKSAGGFIGLSGFVPGAGWNIDFNVGTFLFFQAMFCSTSATIVSGAVAERMKYSSYIISTFLMSLIIIQFSDTGPGAESNLLLFPMHRAGFIKSDLLILQAQRLFIL